MEQLWLIIEREYLTKIRQKSFIIMTFVTPLAIVALATFIGFLTNLNNSKEKHLTILDKTERFKENFSSFENYKCDYLTQGDPLAIKEASFKKEDYGMLYIFEENSQMNVKFFSKDSPSPNFINALTRSIENAIFNQNLTTQNIDLVKIEALKQKVEIELESFDGQKNSEISGVLKIGFGLLAGYLLMMFIVIYGNMIMRSVIEEKTNRIVEIIISSVKPKTLMLGKIFGTSLVGLTQVALWLIIGGFLMTILTKIIGISPSSPNPEQLTENTKMIGAILLEFFKFPIMKLVFSFLLFFIGGYLLYSSVYAAIGASVDNETDTQQFMAVVLIPIMMAMYVGMFTVVEDPHGVVSVVFSYIPLTSSITMLMRIPFGVSWGEILLSLSLLYVSFFVIMWISAKIYRIGILTYGKKPTYKELYKWLVSKE